MIKEYVNLLKSLSNEDLELNINRELADKTKVSSWRLLAICAIIVSRTYTHHKVFLSEIDVSDVVVSLYIYLRNKKTAKVAELCAVARKEIIQITRHFPIYSTIAVDDGVPEPSFYLEHLFYTDKEDAEQKILSSQIVSYLYKGLPLHLRPLFAFYVDTGRLLDDLLSPVDKCLLRLAISEIGGNSVSAEELINKFPKTAKGKSLFLSEMAVRSPELLVLFLLLGDINKLAILTEIFGSENFRIPTTDEVLLTLESSAESANSIENNKSKMDSAFITNLIQNFDIENSELAKTYVDFFKNLLEDEHNIYIRSLTKLERKFDDGLIPPAQYFKIINNELNNTINILERIKKLTSEVNH